MKTTNHILIRQLNRVALVVNFVFVNNHKWLTVRIIIYSAYYRFLVKHLPSKKLEQSMGQRDMESSLEETQEHILYAYRLGNRVERICDKTYWESKCLIKALTAQRFLNHKKIPTTLYMGVNAEDGSMKAHAWLRCGPLFVTGGDGRGYMVVAKFVK